MSRNPLMTRGQLAGASTAKRDAAARAAIQTRAGKSTGVRTQRGPPGSCQRGMVSAALRTSAIDIGATVQGSAAASRSNERADARASASVTGHSLGVRLHRELLLALPLE